MDVPAHELLLLTTEVSRESSAEAAQTHSLAKAFSVHIHKI